jgi:hypothetical protein
MRITEFIELLQELTPDFWLNIRADANIDYVFVGISLQRYQPGLMVKHLEIA